MNERGQVVEAEGGRVKVKMRRSEACEACGACITAGEDMMITARNACGADVGDWVRLELGASPFLSAVLIMYGLPFIFLLAGTAVGCLAAGLSPAANFKEPIGFALGIGAWMSSYFFIKRKDWKPERYTPAAVEKVADVR